MGEPTGMGAVIHPLRIKEGKRSNWLIATGISVCASVGLLYFAATTHGPALRSGVGGVVMGALAVWSVREWIRLGKFAVDLCEKGIRISSDAGTTAMRWQDIRQVQARYVPGIRGSGDKDESNLVSLVLTADGTVPVAIPFEIEDLGQIRSALEEHCNARWSTQVVPNILRR